MLCRWPLGWSFLFEEDHIYLHVYYFSKTRGIVRMRSGLRQAGCEQSSYIFCEGSEVIQSLASERFYTFSVKMFIVLQYYFKRSFPALTNFVA